MKILWAGPNFLHPTTKGGQIRTLGILRQLSRRHEVHYVAFEDPAHPDAPAAAREYCARAYPIRHAVADKRSLRFAAEAAGALFSRLPLAVSRFESHALRRKIEELLDRESFDRMVVDFLAMAPSCPDLGRSVLFQHNVETMIWRRRAEHARGALSKMYLDLQAKRMFEYEREVCRAAGHIIAVSRADAELMRRMFGDVRVTEVPTGVDIEYFERPAFVRPGAELVFVGSMDWFPNVDGVIHFVEEVLPLIRRRRPEARFAIVGRKPPESILKLGHTVPGVVVTGTVKDVRPYLWAASVSVVPLRIGGGTRLKIYESMAAGTPVVSTTVGAEGLEVHPPDDIRIADDPQDFAAHCLDLLEDERQRRQMAARALETVRANYSWERVAELFARVLELGGKMGPLARPAAAGRS
ncbi:MAG: glycosyltransferase family 4 protein [Rhodospirillales bacterium]